jgi:hypothetical protein
MANNTAPYASRQPAQMPDRQVQAIIKIQSLQNPQNSKSTIGIVVGHVDMLCLIYDKAMSTMQPAAIYEMGK